MTREFCGSKNTNPGNNSVCERKG